MEANAKKIFGERKDYEDIVVGRNTVISFF
jgi:hypothetical protein